MLKAVNLKLFLAASLLIVSTIFSTTMAEEQDDPIAEIKAKVDGISLKEKETLQKLFTQVQEIEELEKQEKTIAGDIAKSKGEISGLEKEIAREEAKCKKERENLKLVLQSYQRMGPGSYLEIVLKSDSLPDLLRRINMLRDLTHNTGDLLEQIKLNSEKLSAEKAGLSGKLKLVEAQQRSLLKTLDDKKELKAGLEKYLSSLADERTHFEGYLNSLEKAWSDLKPLFTNMVKELSGIIERGNLPQDTFKASFGLSGIKVTLNEKAINEIAANNALIKNLALGFRSGRVEIKVADKNLVLVGKFTVVKGQSLKFNVEEGSFFGMPLNPGKAKELFQDGSLIFDLKKELGGFNLKSVEVMDGYLVLSI